MKKVLSFVCAMAVAASCTATAFAAGATPGEIVNSQSTVTKAENINSGKATAADYNDFMAKLKDAAKAENAHLSPNGNKLTEEDVEEIAKAVAATIRTDVAGVTGTYQNYLTNFQPAAPAESEPATEQAAASEATVEAPAASEAVTEQPAAEETAPAETPAESEVTPEEPAEVPTESEAAPAEEPAEQDSSEKEVAEQAAEEAAPAAVSEETEEEPAEEAPAASEAAPAEVPAEQPAEAPAESVAAPAEVPAEQPAEAPAESVAAPVEAAAEQVAVQDEATAVQPVEVAKQFGAVAFETRSTNTLDFSGVTGGVTKESKETYKLEANNVPEGEENPYIVTVYGLDKYDSYKVTHNVAGNPQVKVFDVQTNALDSSKRDVTFVALGFSSYTIVGVDAPKTSSGSSSSSSYEAPDDSIYYTCPKCGYHNWTATTGGYRCDHCGYLEEVKELAGWPNVNGVADKSAAAASVYAGAIKATGASMSVVALFALAMAGAVVGGAAYLVRKNGLGE